MTQTMELDEVAAPNAAATLAVLSGTEETVGEL
ncbi:hypothetical protein LCGC14_1742940, partial [marine sediment metagenome]